MAGGRASVAMDAVEVQELLEENMKVQVATIGPDGSPHLTTLFYVLDEGRIAFWTYGSSQKVLNLRRDPRITALVEDGVEYFELRGVSIRGTARLVEDPAEIRALGARVVQRMAGTALDGDGDLGELGEELVAKQARKRVGVVVEPQHVATWDHRKMTGPPGASSEGGR
jgi:PPOX class probable F420-dependent enzyme